MKCQILFSGKNKKNNINLLSSDLAQRVVKVIHVYISSSSPDKGRNKDFLLF